MLEIVSLSMAETDHSLTEIEIQHLRGRVKTISCLVDSNVERTDPNLPGLRHYPCHSVRQICSLLASL